MDYQLSCECGRVHIVTRSQAGQEIPCSCGQSLRVPSLRGLADLPPAEAATAEPENLRSAPVDAEKRRARWRGWRGPSLALASAGFFIAASFCGYYLWIRSGIDTSYTADKEISIGNDMLDTQDPQSLITAWNQFQKSGLRTKDPPHFALWNRYAEQLEGYATTSGAIAAMFGVLALLIWFISARQPVQQPVQPPAP